VPPPDTALAELAPSTEPAGAPPPQRARPTRRSRVSLQKWSRLIHVYSSMFLLLLVLFFGVTGITLNHPDWTFGFDPSSSTVTGTVPSTAVQGGKIDLLSLSEYLRHETGVRGDVDTFGLDATTGYITYRGPGYAADLTIDVKADTYKLSVEKQGLLGVMNDLHKGRSTSALWGHVIDIAGAILVIIAIAGLLLQLALRRRRTATVVVAAIGGAMAMWIAFTTLA